MSTEPPPMVPLKNQDDNPLRSIGLQSIVFIVVLRFRAFTEIRIDGFQQSHRTASVLAHEGVHPFSRFCASTWNSIRASLDLWDCRPCPSHSPPPRSARNCSPTARPVPLAGPSTRCP